MPDVKCVSHNSRKGPGAPSELRVQRQKISDSPRQLTITDISTEISSKVLGRVDLSHNTVQTASPNGEINRGPTKEYSEQGHAKIKRADATLYWDKNTKSKDEIDLLRETEDKLDGEITGVEELGENYVNCKDECEKPARAAALTTKYNQVGESIERIYEQVNTFADHMEAHPQDYDVQQIKAGSLMILRFRKTVNRFKKNITVLYTGNPKLFSGLKPLIDKTSKLIEILKLLSSKFEEFKKKYLDNKNEELIKDRYAEEFSSKGKEYNPRNESGDILKVLINEAKEKREQEYQEFSNKVYADRKT